MAETHPSAEVSTPAVVASEAELAVTGLREGFGDTGVDLDTVTDVTHTIDSAQ